MKPFAKMADVKAGDKLVADGGFTCLREGQVCEVKQDADGLLYVDCDEGTHHLDGQEKDGEVNGLWSATA